MTFWGCYKLRWMLKKPGKIRKTRAKKKTTCEDFFIFKPGRKYSGMIEQKKKWKAVGSKLLLKATIFLSFWVWKTAIALFDREWQASVVGFLQSLYTLAFRWNSQHEFMFWRWNQSIMFWAFQRSIFQFILLTRTTEWDKTQILLEKISKVTVAALLAYFWFLSVERLQIGVMLCRRIYIFRFFPFYGVTDIVTVFIPAFFPTSFTASSVSCINTLRFQCKWVQKTQNCFNEKAEGRRTILCSWSDRAGIANWWSLLFKNWMIVNATFIFILELLPLKN